MEKLSENYFMQADDDMVSHLTDYALKNIDRFETAFLTIRERATKLTTLLCVGVSGCFAMYANDRNQAELLIIATFWSFCIAFLCLKTLKTKSRPFAFGNPAQLYTFGEPLEVLRRKQLYDFFCVSLAMEIITNDISKHFNHALMASALCPVAVFLVFGLARLAL